MLSCVNFVFCLCELLIFILLTFTCLSFDGLLIAAGRMQILPAKFCELVCCSCGGVVAWAARRPHVRLCVSWVVQRVRWFCCGVVCGVALGVAAFVFVLLCGFVHNVRPPVRWLQFVSRNLLIACFAGLCCFERFFGDKCLPHC